MIAINRARAFGMGAFVIIAITCGYIGYRVSRYMLPVTPAGISYINQTFCERYRAKYYRRAYDSTGVNPSGKPAIWFSDGSFGDAYGTWRHVDDWKAGDVIVKHAGELDLWRCLGGSDTCIRQAVVPGLPCAGE